MSDQATAASDLQQKYRQFLDLMPLTISLAGLPTSEGRLFSEEQIEARAITRVFGEGRVLVSSTKSMIGHTMAAAGSLEAVATILALVHQTVPPTANLTTPDPEVGFDCVPRVAREAAIDCAVSNSFGFGGANVAVAFGSFE